MCMCTSSYFRVMAVCVAGVVDIVWYVCVCIIRIMCVCARFACCMWLTSGIDFPT